MSWKSLPFYHHPVVFSCTRNITWFLLFVISIDCKMNAQENCGNGVDDDGDGLIDCLDADCKGNPPPAFYFNTGTNRLGGVLPGGAADLSWKFATDYTGPYSPAIVMSTKPGTYYSSPWPDADWISISSSGYHSSQMDFYYKTTFLLPCFNSCGLSYLDPGALCLSLDYYSDNSIYEIWVNGVPQSSIIKTIPVPSPYSHTGFTASGMLTASLCQNWKPGLNEIILRVSSGPNYSGLLVQSSMKVIPLPTASMTGTSAVCQRDPEPAITFTGSGVPPFTFSYAINHTTVQTVSTTIGNSVSISVPTNATGAFTYTLINVKDAQATACVLKDSVTVTIKPAPVVEAGNNQTVCEGASAVLTATGGTTYQWKDGPATDTYVVKPLSTTTYTVTAYVNGCSASDNVTVAVHPHPSIAITPNPVKICEGRSVILTASGASTYVWSPSKGLSDNTGAVVTASPTTSTNYIVSGTLNGCTTTSNVVVNVDPKFVVDIGKNTGICEDSSIILNAGNPGGIYLWSTRDTVQHISVSSPGRYWVNVTKGLCTISDSIYLSLVPHLNLGEDIPLCNDEITLHTDRLALSYLWSTGQTSSAIVVREPGKYWLTMHVDNCRITDTININEEFNTLYAANSFTPNGDDLNDVFLFKGEGITSFNMKILNRWGEEIFQSNAINTGWDGTLNGTPVEEGLYIWVVKYTKSCTSDKSFRKFGHVTLLKFE